MIIAVGTMLAGFVFALLAGSRNLLVAILLTRSISDPLFELTKGSGGMGVGGGLNLLVLGLALKNFAKDPNTALPSTAIIWFPFLIALIPCAYFTPIPSDGIRWYMTIVTFFSMFILPFYYIKNDDDFLFFMKVILASSVIPVVMAFILPGMEIEEQMRATSTFTHPNIFGFYITAIIFLCLYLREELPKNAVMANKRNLLLMYLLPLFAALLVTKTRSAWLGCALIVLFYAIVHDRRYIAFLVVAGLIGMNLPGVTERFDNLGQGNINEDFAALNSFAWRKIVWSSALSWATENRWFGYGATSFHYYFPWFFPLPFDNENGMEAHNSYVQLLFEAGYVGLGSFIWFIGAMLGTLYVYRNPTTRSWMLAAVAFVSYAVVSGSDNMLQYLAYSWYFFFIMGAICAKGLAQKKAIAS